MNQQINKHFWGVNNPLIGKANWCRGARGGRCDRGCFPPRRTAGGMSSRTASLQGKWRLKQCVFCMCSCILRFLKTNSKMLLVNTWKYTKGCSSFYLSTKSQCRIWFWFCDTISSVINTYTNVHKNCLTSCWNVKHLSCCYSPRKRNLFPRDVQMSGRKSQARRAARLHGLLQNKNSDNFILHSSTRAFFFVNLALSWLLMRFLFCD